MTIVPRTAAVVGDVLFTGGSAAVQGIAMLNPQRWGGTVNTGYLAQSSDGGMLSEVGVDDDDSEEGKGAESHSTSSSPFFQLKFA